MAGEADSPAVVVEQQVGDDFAALQVETAEIGEPLELAALEHRAAFIGVVKADHSGQEHPLAAAQYAQGVVEPLYIRSQLPLALGLSQPFVSALAEPFDAGNLDASFPGLQECRGCIVEVQDLPRDLIKYLLG